MQNIKTQISEILAKNAMQSGRQLYFPLHQSDLSLGDESSNESLIYDSFITDPTEESDRLEEIINQLIFDIKLPESFKNAKLIINNGLLKIWVSEYNDTFQIQLADHSLHIHIHYSGQY